jgi:DNA-binding HxlR family transcriptional regulator
MVVALANTGLFESVESLDEVIHQKVRLGIMSALIATGETDFRFLRETLAVTDGNLSIHLTRLEEAGYIESRKEFVRKKPHSIYRPTDAGRTAFRAYLATLETIVQEAGRRSEEPELTGDRMHK